MMTTSRRTLVKGAAWAVPALTVAAAAPAVALSGHSATGIGNTFMTLSADGIDESGINDPVYDYESATDKISAPSTYWSSQDSNPTYQWNFSGCQTEERFVRGVGVYTPHGTMGALKPGQESESGVNGSGIWIGSPVDESGNPVSGTTTLARGAQIRVTLQAVMNSEEIAKSWNGETMRRTATGKNVYLYGPRTSGQYETTVGRDGTRGGLMSKTWGSIGTDTKPKAPGTSNGWRVAHSGARLSREWTWERQGVNLTGVIMNTLAEDLSVTAKRVGREVHQRYNQVLVNSATLWEAALTTEVVTMTWTMEVVSGTVTATSASGEPMTVAAAQLFPARQIVISHKKNPQASC